MPTTTQNIVVYQYVCRCDCQYVGRTTLRLHNRINQNVPRSIRNQRLPTEILPKRSCKVTKNLSILEKSNSVIGIHLFQNKDCANNYSDQQFSILAKAIMSFYLAVLKAIFIKNLKPELCRQKEFVYSLQISQ